METTARSDGRTLAYETYGHPEGHPVVFCHGTPGSRHSAAVLGDQPLHVVAPDRPGIGGSDPAPDSLDSPERALETWRADVTHLADVLDLDRYSVVGFSGGAPYALAAGQTPGATGVALVAPFGPPETQANGGLTVLARHAPILLRGLFAVQRSIVRRRPWAALSPLTDADPGSLSLPDDVDPIELFAEDYLAATARGGRWPARETATFVEPWELPDPSVPVGVWYGTRDGNVPPSTAAAVADRVADEVTSLPCDHLETLSQAREPSASFLSPSA